MLHYIDIGINLTSNQFRQDREDIVNRALKEGVTQILLTGTNTGESQAVASLAAQRKGVLFATAGIHPHDARTYDSQSKDVLQTLLQQESVVAVGECGLDFDRDFSPRDIQKACFRMQLELSIETGKPLFLHERAASDAFSRIVDEYLPQLPKGVVHCFTGTPAEAKTYLDKGLYIGFTGAISDSQRFPQLEETVRYVPFERMMIETDAPFMLPKNVPREKRNSANKRRNEPAFLPYIAQMIAGIKHTEPAEVSEKTTQTARDFFGI